MSSSETELARLKQALKEKHRDWGDWQGAQEKIRAVLSWTADGQDVRLSEDGLGLELVLPTGTSGRLSFVVLPLGKIAVRGMLPNPDGSAEPYEKLFGRVPAAVLNDGNEVAAYVAKFCAWAADELGA